jgi:hypothetical protein
LPEASLENAKTRRCLDGKGEAQLIHLAYSKAPDGRERWTLELLAEQPPHLSQRVADGRFQIGLAGSVVAIQQHVSSWILGKRESLLIGFLLAAGIKAVKRLPTHFADDISIDPPGT